LERKLAEERAFAKAAEVCVPLPFLELLSNRVTAVMEQREDHKTSPANMEEERLTSSRRPAVAEVQRPTGRSLRKKPIVEQKRCLTHPGVEAEERTASCATTCTTRQTGGAVAGVVVKVVAVVANRT